MGVSLPAGPSKWASPGAGGRAAPPAAGAVVMAGAGAGAGAVGGGVSARGLAAAGRGRAGLSRGNFAPPGACAEPPPAPASRAGTYRAARARAWRGACLPGAGVRALLPEREVVARGGLAVSQGIPLQPKR